MSKNEPRCMWCGAPLDKLAPFRKDVRNSEVCSDECYIRYMGINPLENATEKGESVMKKDIKSILEKRSHTLDDFFLRIDAYAKWLAFAKALAKIVPLDWTKIANEMHKNHCSDEAVAYGLWCCGIDLNEHFDSGIYDELEKIYDEYNAPESEVEE